MASAAQIEADERQSVREMASTLSLTGILLLACLAIFILPTMQFVAREGWSGEEGAHGPIILFTGLWLLWREWVPARRFTSEPNIALVSVLLVLTVPLYVFARVTQIVEIEAYLMYGTLLVVLYSIIGGAAMKRLWFPLLYLGFAFPPPDTLVAAVTVPLKIELSRVSIAFLDLFGYPIGGEGVRIFIGQYELLVAAACSGLNSIISLTAISLFYVYLRHQAEWRYALLLVILVIPIALMANFARVLILILLTYHAGEATAQGFLHNFAGIFMFAVALGLTFLLDELIRPIWKKRVQKVD
ncbi:exosortase V [Qipengyuania atrilutea]|uniref:Exosortase V n=1 Tax=Qipengyuania atrilutea TaxID=2744473 RepID=A0A850H7D5_9SPHN|nr:exosortase V [Actirhodobacter atriluteus]NVD45758.1 exosortase V [Actirhodobacter atriluteus]